MILTALDVESLSKSLSRWEFAEYVFEGFVIIACAGELVASFKPSWLTEEGREHLERRSTIVLVAALSLALICLVRTNELSGYVIGSLGQEAGDADQKAKRAITDSSTALTDSSTALSHAQDALTRAGKAATSLGKAEDQANKAQVASSNALTFARGARQEADSFERDIVSAKEQAAGAESHLADALQRTADAEREVGELRTRVADRHLKPEGKRAVGDKLLPYEGQQLSIMSSNGDSEIVGIATDVIEALGPRGAKWVLAWTFGTIPTARAGGIAVEVDAHAPEKTVGAANALILALKAEGLSVDGPLAQSFPNNIPQMIGGTVLLGSPVYMGNAITMIITKKP
jgi:hypothetical protein